jgi:hypothetical protein
MANCIKGDAPTRSLFKEYARYPETMARDVKFLMPYGKTP